MFLPAAVGRALTIAGAASLAGADAGEKVEMLSLLRFLR